MHTDAPISMYVPARNAERTLADCIATIRAQSRMPDELFILTDPRSTDRTLEIARETGATVVEQTGSTLGAARNEAILHARHRWLASCDSDVILEPCWLEKLAARRPEHVAGIQGRTDERVCTPADAWRALHMPHHWGNYPLRNPFMLVSEVLFDREALLAVGGYRDDLNYYEDSDLCQRLRDAGYDLFYEPASVATHLRSDDTLSLLDLRWKYSEYRQKQHMDRYAGLLRKTETNREYALTTLARSLSHERQELTYISFLLYFHHLILDLRSLHARRPLLTDEQRTGFEQALQNPALAALGRHHPALGECVRHNLADLPSVPPRDDRPHVPVCHGSVNSSSLNRRHPGWQGYLDAMRHAVDAFCREVGAALLSTIGASADYIHGNDKRSGLACWTKPSHEELNLQLSRLPLGDMVTRAFLDDVHRRWPDAGALIPMTTCSEADRHALNAATKPSGTPIGVALNLERMADPRSFFASASMQANGHPPPRRLVACYQPPAQFLPGADVLSAADLASLAGANGWIIRQFDTLVGRTHLMMEKA